MLSTRVVIIDPYNRRQIEDLVDATFKIAAKGSTYTDALQSVLQAKTKRTPPKPAEPSGLGAVVECADGRQFVVDYVHEDGTPRWYGPTTRTDGYYDRPGWASIPAVKVLSEGVTP